MKRGMTSTPFPSLRLFFAPFTRATRPRWLLEELGVPYELVRVDLKAKEQRAPAYLAVHPHGTVPALQIDGTTLLESSAMVAALADRFLDKGLAPAPESPKRAAYFNWLFYAQITAEAALIDVLAARNPDKNVPDENKRADEERWRAALSVLDRELDGKSWILGEAFSAADCVLGAILVWAKSAKATEGFAHVEAYADRCKSRPAFARSRS